MPPDPLADFMTEEQYAVVRFCAEECERQRSGERSVFYYVLAWTYAIDAFDPPETMASDYLLYKIRTLGAMVEPIKNGALYDQPNWNYRVKPIYFRTQLVSVSLLHHETVDEPTLTEKFVEGGAPWGEIAQQMEILVGQFRTLPPEEWYRRFEEIHPFIDGNGRVGALLYNWLRGSLLDPMNPPDFWS